VRIPPRRLALRGVAGEQCCPGLASYGCAVRQ